MYRFRKILCVADPGEARDTVLERAADLAVEHQAELSVIDIVEPRPSGWAALGDGWSEAAVIRARERQLDEALAPLRERATVSARSVAGIPFLRIVREVMLERYDLVIRRCEKPGWLDRALGSDDLKLLRECPCPVWLIDPTAPPVCRRVLAAVDLDTQYPASELETRHALNRRVLDNAFSMAITESAELHIVHAWYVPPPSSSYLGMPENLVADYVLRMHTEHREALDALLRESEEAIGEATGSIERREHLVDGYPRRQVPELARRLDVDLVVMGSVARTGVPGFIVGNTAEMILSQLDCAVLVVKPPGFVPSIASDS